MRGYFGIGVEGVSKSFNAGNLFRTAHAFGASFAFTVNAHYRKVNAADTAKTAGSIPFYAFPSMDEMPLPQGCKLVGIERTDDAIDLPSFHHPQQAAYILGPERSSLTEKTLEKCDYVIQIPMKFSVNLGIAGAMVMYDRLTSLGRFAPRPVSEGGPVDGLPDHTFGNPIFRTMDPFMETPPDEINNERKKP